MKRKPPNSTLALCISLIAHGLGLSALAWWFVLTTPPPKLAAIDREKIYLIEVAKDLAEPPKPEPPKPTEKKKPAPPPDKFDKPLEDDFKDDSGEHDGVGTANRTNHGAKPMKAFEAPLEQADLMTADAHQFDKESQTPAAAGKEDDAQSSPDRAAKTGQVAPSPNLQTVSNDNTNPSALAMATGNLPIPKLAPAPTNRGAATGEPNPPVNKPTGPTPKTKSDMRQIRGHQAEVSDTESEAFAKAPSVVFQNGQLLGRNGLKVNWKRPSFGYAATIDDFSQGGAASDIGVWVDEDGNVLDVILLHTSGSDNVDADRMQAVWASTFEPRKDKDGKILDDHWVIHYR